MPECAVAAYQSAAVWQDFGNIVGEDKCATAIKDISANEITVYPNPAAESFRIGGIGENTLLTLSDITGKIVLQQTVGSDENVSISRFPKGIYLVNVNGKAMKMIKK